TRSRQRSGGGRLNKDFHNRGLNPEPTAHGSHTWLRQRFAAAGHGSAIPAPRPPVSHLNAAPPPQFAVGRGGGLSLRVRRYASRSAISASSLRPANAILLPGI